MNEWFNTGEEAEVTALLHYFGEYKVDTTFHKSTFTTIGLNRRIIFVPINKFLEIYWKSKNIGKGSYTKVSPAVQLTSEKGVKNLTFSQKENWYVKYVATHVI